MTRVWSILAGSLFLSVSAAPALVPAAQPPGESQVAALLLPSPNVDALRALGPGVLPVLASLYEHTDDTNLRLQVQWALGRVSNDPDVVETLVDNMRNDGNPLFRDKAACALANDQNHLTEDQKLRLYQRLIDALRDDRLQVREIALKALQIQTGQTKNFDPAGPPQAREAGLQEWTRWLDAYRSHL